MSGHSKWSKIKHQKAVTDVKRSKTFSKLAQLIAVEAKKAGGDKNVPNLRSVILRAKTANMPALNIERAVKRGVGKDAAMLTEVVYEAYGPGGTALIIIGITDNKNRTSAELRHILSSNGATIAERGGASWAFEKQNGEWKPKTTIPLNKADKEKLSTLIAELEEHDDVQAVFTNTA